MSRETGVEDVDLLLIDGDNLLHDVRGSRDEGGVAWLLPRLSGWRPPHLRIIVGLDGHAAPGEASRKRATRGIEFHHSGRRSADDMLIDLLKAQPFAGRSRTAVVTRDRGLQARTSRAGGISRSIDWLMRQVTGASRRSGAAGKPGAVQPVIPSPSSYEHPRAASSSWAPAAGARQPRSRPRQPRQGR